MWKHKGPGVIYNCSLLTHRLEQVSHRVSLPESDLSHTHDWLCDLGQPQLNCFLICNVLILSTFFTELL